MKQVSAALKAHLSLATTTLCSCWRIERKDGKVLCFTDHDVDLMIDGERYEASTGFMRSAIANSGTLAVDNLEVNGFLDSDSISSRDLRAGRFDFAKVSVFIVNWTDLSQGKLKLRSGVFGEVTIQSSGLFTIELRGLVQQLQQTFGDIYIPECRTDLGSKKCKVSIEPPTRVANGTYKKGQRVKVANSRAFETYQLPVMNPSFGDFATKEMVHWKLEGMEFQENAFSVRPDGVAVTTDWNAAITQSVTLSQFLPTEASDSRPAKLTATALVRRKGHRSRLFVRSLGTNDTVLSENYTAYELMDQETVDKTLEFTVPNGTLRFELGMQFNRGTASQAFEGQPIPEFSEDYRAEIDTIDLAITNAQGQVVNVVTDPVFGLFEADTGTTAGWSNMRPITQSEQLFGRNGGRFAVHNSTVYGDSTNAMVSLDMPILTGAAGALPLSYLDVDAGKYELELSWWQANSDQPGQGVMEVQFYNPITKAYTSERRAQKRIIPINQWQQQRSVWPIPAGSRSYRIVIRSSIQAEAEGYGTNTRPRTAFDDVEVQLRTRGGDVKDYSVFGGVEYEALNDGTTASAPPLDWSRQGGTEIVDGGVRWKVQQPLHKHLCTIRVAEGFDVFHTDRIGKPANWFRWGSVEFLTGENAGFAVEVLESNTDTTIIRTVLPLPHKPAIGDVFLLTTGCDKSRETCWAKFQNILNFRGEPDVPGTDQYFQVAQPGNSTVK